MLTKDSPEFVLSEVGISMDKFIAWCKQIRERDPWVRLRITSADDHPFLAICGYQRLRGDPVFNTVRVITVLDGDVSLSALLLWLASHGRRITPRTSVSFQHGLETDSDVLKMASEILASHTVFTMAEAKAFGGNLQYRQFATGILLGTQARLSASDLRRFFHALVEP